ncbi:hypothetical protein K2173_019785 [Erythroxylum novogranatense]|uniref:BHLH domain-containing protein n=1 Tax=Erythroxylum novogranatense TaxID=1862640 RepID=A0AAV8SMA5_9ROSI|nr:hypothetical protein K2173_019785 [Erythroxylum novogranatense]
MALEAVVLQQDLFSYGSKELYNLLGGSWGFDNFGLDQNNDEDEKFSGFSDFHENQTESPFHLDWSSSPPHLPLLPPTTVMTHLDETMHRNKPTLDANNNETGLACTPEDADLHQLDESLPANIPATRAKRRRARNRKNKEEIENQRMTHIAVERNRRKQMNEYLSVLRSLMPESYVQRGDQASIIGGAINFVKELEQRLQFLGAHKEKKEKENCDGGPSSQPFSEFFTFPQYSTSSSNLCDTSASGTETQPAIADIEVTMVESHANLKIRSKRQPKQLLKVVSELHNLRLTILHLNVSTMDQTVLYSLSVKVEDDCKLTSVDEIATAVYQMFGRLQEESIS